LAGAEDFNPGCLISTFLLSIRHDDPHDDVDQNSGKGHTDNGKNDVYQSNQSRIHIEIFRYPSANPSNHTIFPGTSELFHAFFTPSSMETTHKLSEKFPEPRI